MSAELEQRIAQKNIEPATARELRDFERFLTVAGPAPAPGEKRVVPAEWGPYIDGTGPAPADIDRLREQIMERLMSTHRADEQGARRRPADGHGEGPVCTNTAIAMTAADRALAEIRAQGYEIVGKRPDAES